MSACSSCAQMKKENRRLRAALMETNAEYVAVVNENLKLHRQLSANEKAPS